MNMPRGNVSLSQDTGYKLAQNSLRNLQDLHSDRLNRKQKEKEMQLGKYYKDLSMLQNQSNADRTYNYNINKENNTEKYRANLLSQNQSNADRTYNYRILEEERKQNSKPIYFKKEDGTYGMYSSETPMPERRLGGTTPVTKEVYNSFSEKPKQTGMTEYQSIMSEIRQQNSKNRKEKDIEEQLYKKGIQFDKNIIPNIANWKELTPEQKKWMKEKYINSNGTYIPEVKSSGGFLGIGKNYIPNGYTISNKKSLDDLAKAIDQL